MPKTVHDTMNIIKVLPDEPADAWVVWDGLEAAVSSLITGGRAAHTTVVDKRLRYMRNLGFKNERNITMKNRYQTRPALGQAGISQHAQWGLKHGQVLRLNSKGAMVITNKEVEEQKADSTSETFCKLLDKRQDSCIFDHDLIQGL